MITDRDDLYELAIDVHDCAGSVRRGAGLPRFAGWNFRASEIQGAVARVQLTRLDGLLERMRANQARLAERVGASCPGLTLRRAERRRRRRRHLPDRVRRATPALAAEAVDALRRRGRRRRCGSTTRDVIDLHVYPFWKPVLDAIADAGPPAPDCPRTLDLLERTIHVDVSPLLRRAGPRRDRARVREGRRAAILA